MKTETGISPAAAPPHVSAPWLVALNLTKRCNLGCAHCYLDAEILRRGAVDEMSTQEVCTVLVGIAEVGPESMVVLTGGEPLLRKDLEDIAGYASGLGLMVVVGTNGVLLTRERIRRLKEAGVAGIGLSLDSLRPERHDVFRGRRGAWLKTMQAIDACRKENMAFQLHFSATDDNAEEIDAMIAFARESGAMVLNVFFMVCTGRGERYSDISPERYEDVLRRVADAARTESSLMVRAKCAPHFKRIATELDPNWEITAAHGYDAGGCIAGTHYARITPEGHVTPCPYMENIAGSVRDQAFAEIWKSAPVFAALRAPKLEGRCGVCEYSRLCGGCRARPLARDGNMMAEDFLCNYQPQGGPVIAPDPVPQTLTWAADAAIRLERLPGFVRRMVRKRTETHVRAAGRSIVTLADLEFLMARRFGPNGPPGLRRPPEVAQARSGSDA